MWIIILVIVISGGGIMCGLYLLMALVLVCILQSVKKKKKKHVFLKSILGPNAFGVWCVIAQTHRQMVMRKKGSNRKSRAAGQGRAGQEK